ncbi:MAG: hypothetical protein ACR2GO_06250 [Candidatus Limnocylindria bacterium]
MRISFGSRPGTTTVALSVIVSLAACASPASPSSSAKPTLAERPAVPEGWAPITSDEGDVRLVLPPDAGILLTAGGILAHGPLRDGNVSWEVWAIGPDALIDQPRAGQSMVEWLGQLGFMPQPGEAIAQGPTTELAMTLPAGRALEVATSLQPGTPEEGRAIIYVIETGGRLAMLRFVGTPAGLERRARDIQLISQLVEFGDQLEQSKP